MGRYKGFQAMRKGVSKTTVKLIVTLAAAVLAAIILIHHNPLADPQEETVKKGIACLIIVGAMAIFYRFYDRLVSLPVELWQSRQLIWKLSKNDFKNRYAGSYLGRLWAFTQPVVTVLLYWFVFGHVMGQDKKEILTVGVEAPYVLWLTAGLVPWFYFSEAINNGTTSLLEYSYLVKKVVFKISIIPIVKLIAASFVHLFFVTFYADRLFCVWLCTVHISVAAIILHFLHVYVCACAQLFDLCDRDFFPGFDADYQYYAASGHVGNPDIVEYLHVG